MNHERNGAFSARTLIRCVIASAAVMVMPQVHGADANSDFNTRCTATGVIRCVNFDDISSIPDGTTNPRGIFAGVVTPGIDSNVKASGGGSLKFTVPSNSGSSGSGSYFTNFADDLSVQFGGGQEIYVQWRQRFSPEFLSTVYAGSGGAKQLIIGTGDQPGVPYYSCTSLEVVVQNTLQRGFPQMYNSCSGSASHGAYNPFEEPFGSFDFKMQNARPAPYCLYSQGNVTPKAYFAPAGNCFGYFANEWMTFQVGIRIGPRVGDEFVGSIISLWVSREGRPTELVLQYGPYNLTAGAPATNQRFGKVWLLPYQTGKDASQSHPVAYVWYDELILSRNRIPDPGAPVGPKPPTNLTTH